jgi:hypothetical protein
MTTARARQALGYLYALSPGIRAAVLDGAGDAGGATDLADAGSNLTARDEHHTSSSPRGRTWRARSGDRFAVRT